MSYARKPLTGNEQWFLYGSGFAEFSVFVVVLVKLISERYPLAAYIEYGATICIFLQAILRYIMTARVYHTEKSVKAWGVTMLIVLIGAVAVYSCDAWPVWFVFVMLLFALGDFKTLQARNCIKTDSNMSPTEKEFHIRMQDGLFSVQSLMILAMLAAAIAAYTRLGDNLAVKWFGVSDLLRWRNGISVSGSILLPGRDGIPNG